MSFERQQRVFRLFLGFHTLLIGLLPFFLPVFLVKQGASPAEICAFIAITGAGFFTLLLVWDRLLRRISFTLTLVSSFAFELLLVALLLYPRPLEILPLLALANGAYNALFWMVQRILFVAVGRGDDNGRRFGNFQIYVTIVLKIGILLGGLILDHSGLTAVALLSLVTALTAVALLRNSSGDVLPAELMAEQPLSLTELATFRDRCGSRLSFAVDGFYLYLESYFWLISLFLLVKQNYRQLGLLVIALAISFTLIFYLLKNRIDAMERQRVYRIAVALYALSWGLRASVGEGMDSFWVYPLLISIAFCTTFFRLAYNKRFFDIVRSGAGYPYLFHKSYWSQFFIVLSFGLLALLAAASDVSFTALPLIYTLAALSAPLFLLYRATDGVCTSRG